MNSATAKPTDMPEYGIWKSIRHRCERPSHQLYPLYGAKGIKVCARWSTSFEAFLEDMGRRPLGANHFSRIDPNGDFSPANCQWVHRKTDNDARRAATPLTADRLRQLFDYDQNTGQFFCKNGNPIGHKGSQGYITLKIDQRSYRAHRLAWLYIHGEWPQGQIDHLNRERSDNRIANLREADVCLNMQNSSSGPPSRTGVRGVAYHPATGKFAAYINRDRKKHWLGVYDTVEEAAEARRAAEAELDAPRRLLPADVRRATPVRMLGCDARLSANDEPELECSDDTYDNRRL